MVGAFLPAGTFVPSGRAETAMRAPSAAMLGNTQPGGRGAITAGDIGTSRPLGIYDPLQLIGDDPVKYRRFQELEIKHGRIAMLASVHVLVTLAGFKWSGYASYLSFPPLKFEDIPGGTLGSWEALPQAGWAQIVALVAILDNSVFAQEPGNAPGDVVRDANGEDRIPWVRYDDPDVREFKLNAERNNGRAAMMGIYGMMIHEYLTGNPVFPIAVGRRLDEEIAEAAAESEDEESEGEEGEILAQMEQVLAQMARSQEDMQALLRQSPRLRAAAESNPKVAALLDPNPSNEARTLLQFEDQTVQRMLEAVQTMQKELDVSIATMQDLSEKVGAVFEDPDFEALCFERMNEVNTATDGQESRTAVASLKDTEQRSAVLHEAMQDIQQVLARLEAPQELLAVLRKSPRVQFLAQHVPKVAAMLQEGTDLEPTARMAKQMEKIATDMQAIVQQQEDDGLAGVLAATEAALADPEVAAIFAELQDPTEDPTAPRRLFAVPAQAAPRAAPPAMAAKAPVKKPAAKTPVKKAPVKKAPVKPKPKKSPVKSGFPASGSAIKVGDIGTTRPLGVYDPLQLMTKMPDKYRRWQEMEIKHGRIAMAACTHVFLTLNGVRWPGYLSYAEDIKFEDMPGGTWASWAALPDLAWLQIVLVFALLDNSILAQKPENAPGDIMVGNPLWVRYDDPDTKEFKLNVERNNGRAAMMGITGMMIHEALTGNPVWPIEIPEQPILELAYDDISKGPARVGSFVLASLGMAFVGGIAAINEFQQADLKPSRARR